MTSRERLAKALNHIETDRPPVDLGATNTTGISAIALNRLRRKLGLDEKIEKVNEPFQLLGEVDDDIRKVLGIDVIGIFGRNTFFGYSNDSYKKWNISPEQEVWVGEGFTTTVDDKGDTYVYPQGDKSVAPSGKLPCGGYYFDGILRKELIDEDNLTPREDFKEQFSLLSDEDLLFYQKQVYDINGNTDFGTILMWGGGSLGDVALLPGTNLKKTPGVRDIQEWYMYHLLYPEYITEVFDLQVEMAIENLKLINQAVGDKIQSIFVSGTDFGTQISSIISHDSFVELYKPRYKKINDWIHKNTNWKTFFHSCGAVYEFLGDFVEMGVDIINPVQCSASGMDAQKIKNDFGDKLVFWGGGVDTQKTLPFGTPEEVYLEAKKRIEVFSKGGGYVFNPIHNVQAPTSAENLLAFFRAIKR